MPQKLRLKWNAPFYHDLGSSFHIALTESLIARTVREAREKEAWLIEFCRRIDVEPLALVPHVTLLQGETLNDLRFEAIVPVVSLPIAPQSIENTLDGWRTCFPVITFDLAKTPMPEPPLKLWPNRPRMAQLECLLKAAIATAPEPQA